MPSSPSAPSGIRPLGTKVYTYDDLYRLTGEQVIGGTAYTKTFGYDPVGNRQTQTTAGSAGSVVTPGVVNYGYDTRDRLLTENATTYGYDANGNLTTQSGFGTYTFDTENRLVRIAKFDGTLIEHAYDADGIRIRTKTAPPASPTQTTNFLVDTSGGLSHVLAESSVTGAQTAHYLRALDDLLAVIRPAGTRYYHADGIGSVRKLTDETGAVTDSYEYTAFGEQYEDVGADPQPYSFAGEPLDPNTGFQYHRARWMQPSTGGFQGVDPAPGCFTCPMSLHDYLYAEANPVTRIDPSGLTSVSELNVSLGIQTTLRSSASLTPHLARTRGGTVIKRLICAAARGLSARKPEVHHIATNKHTTKWTAKFEDEIFGPTGMNLKSAFNKVSVPGHKGRHSTEYHEYVYGFLRERIEPGLAQGLAGEALQELLTDALIRLAEDICNPSGRGFKLLMRAN